MSFFTLFHHHNFFKNKELNHFYLAIAIMIFGESLINIFVPIYLYQAGFSVSSIITFYFLLSFSFVIFSYLGAKIVARIGVKHSILFSTPFIIFYYLGLSELNSFNWLFFILPVLLSLRMIFYNYGYHLNYIIHSNRKKRGRELSFIGIITIIMTIIAPLLGGLLAAYSFKALFILGASLVVLGTLPLFITQENYETIEFTSKDLFKKIIGKKQRGNLISFSGYAIESVIGRVIWPVFLIIILRTTSRTGLIVTASMLLSMVVFYMIGKFTDKYDKIKLLKIGTLLYFFGWVGRIFASSSFRILLIDSYKNVSEKILHIPWEAHSYDLAAKENYFRFIVSREIIFNLSRIIVMPILILVFWLNFYPFIISFIIASGFSLGYLFINKA